MCWPWGLGGFGDTIDNHVVVVYLGGTRGEGLYLAELFPLGLSGTGWCGGVKGKMIFWLVICFAATGGMNEGRNERTK